MGTGFKQVSFPEGFSLTCLARPFNFDAWAHMPLPAEVIVNTPNTSLPPSFTAAQYAAALGISKRAILNALRHTPATSEGFANGQRAQLWSLASLPDRLRDELDAAARQRGCRNAAHFLAEPPEVWKPAVPLARLPAEAVDKAARLQRALRPLLERMHDLSEAEFSALGVEHYRREIGHVISARHWRRLFKRTCARDNGAEDWSRLEIYLDEALVRRSATPAPVTLDHHELTLVIAAFNNPAQPTPQEIECLWLRALELYRQRINEGREEKKVRRDLLSFLNERAIFLAGTAEGLRKQFARKLQRWLEQGGAALAVADGRRERSGNFRAPEFSQADRDKLVGHAVLNTGGRVAQAWRELMRAGELSDGLSGYYLSNPSRKSYVPRRVLDEVKYDVAMLDDIHHGPRQAKLNGPHLERDWSNVFAGDWYQADDVTFPVYYYEPDGKGWFTLWRGQCLLMIDLRTTRILGYALLSSRNYNSLAIKTTITRTCDEHGLPRRGFYFERGIWQSSKILAGDRSAPLSLPETEKGLRDLGLDFIHSNLPRSKPVERTLGAVQSLMERIPGYAGRDANATIATSAFSGSSAKSSRGKRNRRGISWALQNGCKPWTKSAPATTPNRSREPCSTGCPRMPPSRSGSVPAIRRSSLMRPAVTCLPIIGVPSKSPATESPCASGATFSPIATRSPDG